jgi:hypothetical protein
MAQYVGLRKMGICNPNKTIEKQFTTFSSQDFTLFFWCFFAAYQINMIFLLINLWLLKLYLSPRAQVLGHLPCLATGSINTTASTTALRFSG